ncbi:hypothetical protein [Edaphobacter modestus]|nr:hypothetical protein [Edaphobacter modestus]
MMQIRLQVLFVTLGGMLSVAILANASKISGQTSAVTRDETVVNVPYSAQRRFTSIAKAADGTINRTQSGGSEARDSSGRTYSAGERHWTYTEGGKSVLKSEMLYRIHDPVANTDTKWDSSSKEVKVIHWPKSVDEQGSSNQPCEVCFQAATSDSGEEAEKLGIGEVGGVVAVGTRNSYTIPAGKDHHDTPVVVVHETWYCPELKIVILETNVDPRSGETRNELVDIVRGEPGVGKYQPPADYIVHQVQIPSAAGR